MSFDLGGAALGQLTLGGIEDPTTLEVVPGVATLTLVGVSPVIAGGVETVVPEVAVLTLVGVVPTVSGGVDGNVPSVATLTLVGISPTVLGGVDFQGAVLGVFGFDAAYLADEWDFDAQVLGSFGSG